MKGSLLFKPLLHLRSATPGRERWEVRGLFRKPHLAQRLESQLGRTRGIRRVEASPLSGRILVRFDPVVHRHGVAGLIQKALDDVVLGVDGPTAEPGEHPSGGVGDKGEKGEKGDLGRIRDLIRRVASDAPGMGGMSALSTGSTLVSLLAPVTLGGIMTVAITGPIGVLKWIGLKSAVAQLGALGAGFLLLELVELKLEQTAKKAWTRYATDIEHDLRNRAFERLATLDMAFPEQRSSGELRSIIHEDAVTIRKFLEAIPHSAIEKTATFAVGGVFLLGLSPAAFMLSLTPLPACYWLFHRYRGELAESYGAQAGQEAGLSHQITNSISGLATIKSYTTETYEQERVSEAGEALRDLSRNAQRLSAVYANGIRYSVTAGISLPMLYTGKGVIQGAVSVPAYTLLIFLLPRLVTSMTGLDNDYDLYMRAASAAGRLQDLLDQEPQILGGTRRLASGVKGGLRFDHLTFGYKPGQPIFRDFNLEVAPGSAIAFVGATGSGKSTLIKLLLRYYDPDQGGILLDGHDIRDLDLEDLRRCISFVSQDVFLFQGSIYDNIRYGRPDATREEVEEAARLAEALDFIHDSEHGFDTVIGERGLNLSGGQRQRLSIARAILKNAPILILDEATSSVDNETEAAIQASVNSLLRDRTLIIIAHRLSTVRHVNQIHVIDKGTIRESGTHEELLNADGVYASLWKLQTGERHPTIE